MLNCCFRPRAEAELFEQLLRSRLALLAPHAMIGGVIGQNLAHAQAAIQIRALRRDGDTLPDADGIFGDIQS